MADCSNHCPDEKGTERNSNVYSPRTYIKVATIAPMKRGLKVCIGCYLNCTAAIVATIAPMKRGLKVSMKRAISQVEKSSNHCPDEKDQATE